MKRIILIDDSEETFVLVKDTLSSAHQVTWAPSIQKAKEFLEETSFDLILLDVSLPDGDGYSYCIKLQNQEATSDTPLIFVTGRKGTSNLVAGLAVGADDYIEKPFDPLEFHARVEAKLNKSKKKRDLEENLIRGHMRVSISRQSLFLELNGIEKCVLLTGLEFKLLCHLARNEDIAFTRDQLISSIWGEELNVLDRTVDRHISQLRKKLGVCSAYIQTVSGFGYKFSSKDIKSFAA